MKVGGAQTRRGACFLTTCQQRGAARRPTTAPRVVSGRDAATASADAASTKGPAAVPAARRARGWQARSVPLAPSAAGEHASPGHAPTGRQPGALPFLLFILELPFRRGAPPGSRGAGRSRSAGGERCPPPPRALRELVGRAPAVSAAAALGPRRPLLGCNPSDTWASSCRDRLAAGRGLSLAPRAPRPALLLCSPLPIGAPRRCQSERRGGEGTGGPASASSRPPRPPPAAPRPSPRTSPLRLPPRPPGRCYGSLVEAAGPRNPSLPACGAHASRLPRWAAATLAERPGFLLGAFLPRGRRKVCLVRKLQQMEAGPPPPSSPLPPPLLRF